RRRGELSTPGWPALDLELQERVGRPIVEPVHDPTRLDRSRYRIVREDFHRHLLVDDLADLFTRAVCKHDASAVMEAPEHDPDLHADLVDEYHAGLALGDRAGELAQRLRHEPRLEPDVRVAHLALDLGARHQ